MRRRAPLAAAALAAVALSACGEPAGPSGTGAGSLPLDARSPLEPPGQKIRVLVELQRPSLADQMATSDYAPGRQRAYVSSLHDEVEALQSSLRAKDVELDRPQLFGRVWNGFAVTIRARDLPKLQALGLRAEPVRRFYGAATSATVAAEAGPKERPSPGADAKPDLALLDTGVNRRARDLRGRIVRGHDAVGHDSDPSPRGHSERHGTAMARVLLAARDSGPVLSVRVAGIRRDPESGAQVEYGTTDELIEGLERTVDPDGDGDVSDRVPVALVGVNSPYAGFDDSAEAEAAAGATKLGTLLVAPAGNEGPRAGRSGTIGSPAASPDVLAVGALEGGGAPALPSVEMGLATSEGRMKADAPLLGGSPRKALRAPVTGLAGASQAAPKATGRALGDSPLEYFGVDAAPRARGRVVVVPARSGTAGAPAIAGRAAAAAAAGAAALVVCEPDGDRPLPALPDGAAPIPALGLRGDAAQQALDITDGDGGIAFISEPDQATDDGELATGRNSSQGPTYSFAPKPDVVALGTAQVGDQFTAGTSVAAARVAATAARLRRDRPDALPAELAARLAGTAAPRGPLLVAGAGEPRVAQAEAATTVIEPAVVGLPRQDAGETFTATARVTVRNTGEKTVTVKPAATLAGTRVKVEPEELEVPAGKARGLTVTATATGDGRPPGYLTGRLRTGRFSAPLALPVGPPPPAPLSELELVRDGRRTVGVRFTAGAVKGAGYARDVQPLGDLRLQVLDAEGAEVRDLTPQGGARDLLPGEYQYRLTKEAMDALQDGPFRFRATAHGPAGGPATVRTSEEFRAG